MSFDETFKHRVDIDEHEAFKLAGQTRKIRELQPSNFAGPVATWAGERESRYGDSIIPRFVYMEKVGKEPHRVAWVLHGGMDFETGEAFCNHHIACDCLLEAESSGTPELMFCCSALQKVLNKRAWLVSETFKMDQVLGAYQDLELDDYEQNSVFHDLSVHTVAYLLEYDARHPEGWVANVISGQHTASLIGLIMQQPPEVVRWYAEILEQEGMVEFDGETINLTQEALSPKDH